MKLMYWVASLTVEFDETGNIRKDRMSAVNASFILMYFLITVGLVGIIVSTDCSSAFNPNAANYASASQDLGHILLVYCLLLFSFFNIHLWVYMARRFVIGLKGRESFLNDDRNPEIYRVWKESLEWFEPFQFTNRNQPSECAVIKIIYTLSWISMLAMILYSMNTSGIFEISKIEISLKDGGRIEHLFLLLGIVSYAVSMFLNYFSYFMCIGYAVFIKNVARIAAEIPFNHQKPSATLSFHNLIHSSSRVAMAFFSDSMLYVIMSAFIFGIGGYFRILDQSDTVAVVMIMMCIMIPCIISFLLVFLLPKVFLSRLLRKWKFKAAGEIDERIRAGKYAEITENEEAQLERIYSDRLPLVKTELVTATAAVCIDIVSVVVTLTMGVG